MQKTSLVSILIIGIMLPILSLSARNWAKFEIPARNTVQNIRSGGTVDLKMNARLGKNNHLYIKHLNSMSFNILTNVTADPKSGFRAEFSELPDGSEHENDVILEGQGMQSNAGSWTIRVYEVLGRDVSKRIYPLKLTIESQVCNSRTNRCYRPEKHAINLRLVVSEEKQKTSFRAMSDIKWITSVSEARSKARSSGQNVYVIITAPTWCGYCKQMERNTFTDKNVAKILNEGFVPLRILDTNSDKKQFRFSGYPTQILLKSNFQEITRSIPRAPNDLYSFLSKYKTNSNTTTTTTTTTTDTDSSLEEFSFSVVQKGSFKKTSGKNWIRISNDGQKEFFTETKRGQSFIILRNNKSKQYLALPENGGQVYIYQDNKWNKSGSYSISKK